MRRVAVVVALAAGVVTFGGAPARALSGNGSARSPWRLTGGEYAFGKAKVGDWVSGPCYAHESFSDFPPKNGDSLSTSWASTLIETPTGGSLGDLQAPQCKPGRFGTPGRHRVHVMRGTELSRMSFAMWFVESRDEHTSRVPIWVRGPRHRPSKRCELTVVGTKGTVQTYVPGRGLSGAEPAGEGRVIKAGRAIQAGHDSWVTVMFPDGGHLHLQANSGLVLDPRMCANPGARQLAQRRVKVDGDGTLDTERQVHADIEFEYKGRKTTGGARGTRIDWRTDPDRGRMVVRVASGALAFPPRGRARFLVRAGRCVELSRRGIARRPFPCGELHRPAALPPEQPADPGPPAAPEPPSDEPQE